MENNRSTNQQSDAKIKKCAQEAKALADKVAKDIGFSPFKSYGSTEFQYTKDMIGRIGADKFQACVSGVEDQLSAPRTPANARKATAPGRTD